jgi:dTDP-4-dehydrorhamnose 3,5-epimerase
MTKNFDQPRHIKLNAYVDKRGVFFEIYNKNILAELGITTQFVQDNFSMSHYKGTIRGLHFQSFPTAQTKLITCLSGKILDVVVDIRKDSPTFSQISYFELDAQNPSSVYVPQGFAHGFCTLTDNAYVSYKVDNFYSPKDDGGIRFDDPSLNIDWQLSGKDPILSEKDSKLPYLSDITLSF